MVRTTGTKCCVRKAATERHCRGRKFYCTCWWSLPLKLQGSDSLNALSRIKVRDTMLLFILLKESLISFQYRPHFSFFSIMTGCRFWHIKSLFQLIPPLT